MQSSLLRELFDFGDFGRSVMVGDLSWAIAVKEENLQLILSEAGDKFNKTYLESWLKMYKEGYFLRDEKSTRDCALFLPFVFLESYYFLHNDPENLIRQVSRR